MRADRFGELAVRLGYLTQEQLDRALAVQRQEDRELLPHRPLGTICLSLGYLTPDEVRTIVHSQGALPGSVRLRDS